VSDTKVTEQGMWELAPLTKLRYLLLGDLDIPDAAQEKFQRVLPRCRIIR
jgi:hypothetical protein